MANHAPVIRIPGTLDFIISDNTGISTDFYRGHRDGSFTQGPGIDALEAQSTLGDINNDGLLDIVAVEVTSFNLATFLGVPGGGFSRLDNVDLTAPGSFPLNPALAD